MARRSDHTRDELKELIVTSTHKIIEDEGVHNVTARRLAQDIGYAPGTIYNLFSSMDDLLMYINGKTLDELYNALIHGSSGHDSHQIALENIKEMAKSYICFAHEKRPFWLMLFMHDISKDGDIPDWYQDKITKLFEPLEDLLIPFFDKDNFQERKKAARILWSSIHGLCLLKETQKITRISDEQDIDHMSEYLIDHFMMGIMSR